MNLHLLLKLQGIYFILGTLYNIISIIMIHQGMNGLASTSPYLGLLVMAVYGLFLIPGFSGRIYLYRILMGISLIVLGYGGVLSHILNHEHLYLYHSTMAWMAAIMINSFGTVLNLIALLGLTKNMSHQ